jgi:hypothetical protein
MRMTRSEKARLIVAGAYAARTASPKTLAFIESLKRDNQDLSDQIGDGLSLARVQGAREVGGGMLSTVTLGLAITLAWSWFNYTQEGYCSRIGWRQGMGRSDAALELGSQLCLPDARFTFGAHPATAAMIEVMDAEPQRVTVRAKR